MVSNLEHLNVMVLEDSLSAMLDLTHKLSKRLNEEGIHRASNYDEAYAIVNSINIDIALVDLSMPARNGMDFLIQLKDDPDTRDIPVIITTAVNPNSMLVNATKDLANGLLFKPVDEKALFRLMKTAIQPSQNQPL